jgi:diaminopropionate ammonia-lyase
MNGLACQTLSTSVWPTLQAGIDLAVAIEDSWTLSAMRALAEAAADGPLVAGETGAAAFGALLACAGDAGWRRALGLSGTSRVLVPVTEGATDPERYAEIVGRSAAAVRHAASGSGDVAAAGAAPPRGRRYGFG